MLSLLQGDDTMGDSVQMLEFMLRNVLAGKPESEVHESLKKIHDSLSDVLYPTPVLVDAISTPIEVTSTGTSIGIQAPREPMIAGEPYPADG